MQVNFYIILILFLCKTDIQKEIIYCVCITVGHVKASDDQHKKGKLYPHCLSGTTNIDEVTPQTRNSVQYFENNPVKYQN